MFKQSIIFLLVLSAVSGIGGFHIRQAEADQAVFGPKRFLRTTAALNVYEDHFTAVEGPGELTIRNCEEDSIHRVTSARILLNGAPLFAPEDFKQNQFVLKFPLSLRQSNNLKVEIGGKPGAYLVIEIRQTGLTNPPTVSLSADPETIVGGGSSTLTWTSTGADSASLEPGMGSVAVNGSLTVTPGETTLYKITVTGPGGTATAAAAVNVLYQPTASFNAEPSEINAGETVSLTWTTTHADSVNIEPGIGPVDLNGTRTVTPAQTTTYTLTAIGAGGTRTASVTITVHNPLTLQITSPLDGAQVSGGTISVKGTVTHAGNKETGVTVNGVLALIGGNEFIADHVPLLSGKNTITARATDALGATMTDSITVYADTSGDYIELTADPVSGMAPFETTLRIDGSFDFAASDITYTGPGTAEFLEGSQDQYRVRLSARGIYTFTATVVDDQGHSYADSMSVEVVDEAAIDGLLQAKWGGMKAALIAGDIEGALRFQHDDAHERYAAIYTALGNNLSMLAQNMRPVAPILIEGSRAKYRTTRDHIVDGQTVTITYYVYFSQDENGIWKIEMY